ncbi:hypothetical protein DI09_450p10, partial [Mitosporidium daphniae]
MESNKMFALIIDTALENTSNVFFLIFCKMNRKKKKSYISLFLSFGTIIAQNGTQPDSARVIVGSQANISVDVLLNDNLNANKDYELISVYKSTTSTSVNISTNGSKAQYQDPQG